jgi:hypothetical protein
MQSEAHEPLTLAVVFENLQALQKTFALKAAIELDISERWERVSAMWRRSRSMQKHRSAMRPHTVVIAKA